MAITIKQFLSATKKLLKNNVDNPNSVRDNRAFIRSHVEWLLGFKESRAILEKHEKEGKTDFETIMALQSYFKANEFNLNLEAAEVALKETAATADTAKRKHLVVAEIHVQVWDTVKREYTEEYEIVKVPNDKGVFKDLTESFATDSDARRWVSNKIFALQPANRHIGKIIDSRFEQPKTIVVDPYEADKAKTQKFGHTQVNKTTKPNAPLKQKMKAKGDVFRFSKG